MPILSPDAADRARRIRLIAFDVDGVLTDGTIWYFPTEASADARRVEGEAMAAANLIEVKGFNAHDGIGMALGRRAGLILALITKRRSQTLALRARDLRIQHVHQGVEFKGRILASILQAEGLSAQEACCMGDDIVDMPMMRHCGLAAAPADARPEVRAAAHFVADQPGGRGAARDLIEFILRTQGRWEATAAQYITDSEGEALETQEQ